MRVSMIYDDGREEIITYIKYMWLKTKVRIIYTKTIFLNSPGVLKSFPTDFEYSRNSSVALIQTV